MTAALIAVSLALVGAVGGLIGFAWAALSRADTLHVESAKSWAAISQLEDDVEKEQADRVAAEATLNRAEIANEETTDDPILEAFFARALDAVNPATRRDLISGIAAARRVHENRDADDPDRSAVSVSGPSGPSAIAELE